MNSISRHAAAYELPYGNMLRFDNGNKNGVESAEIVIVPESSESLPSLAQKISKSQLSHLNGNKYSHRQKRNSSMALDNILSSRSSFRTSILHKEEKKEPPVAVSPKLTKNIDPLPNIRLTNKKKLRGN